MPRGEVAVLQTGSLGFIMWLPAWLLIEEAIGLNSASLVCPVHV